MCLHRGEGLLVGWQDAAAAAHLQLMHVSLTCRTAIARPTDSPRIQGLEIVSELRGVAMVAQGGTHLTNATLVTCLITALVHDYVPTHATVDAGVDRVATFRGWLRASECCGLGLKL